MTTQPPLTQIHALRRKLAAVEAQIVELIAERERLVGELRWQSRMETDRLGSRWLAEQGREWVEWVEEYLGVEG